MSDQADSPLEFPCRWPVKAMVRTGDDAMRDVLSTIGRHAELPDAGAITVKPSRRGRFESITVVIEARSREHLETIYTELRALEAVKMTL